MQKIHFLVLICFASLLSASEAKRPVISPFLGLTELITPAYEEGLRASQNFHYVAEDKFIHLEYDTERSERVFVLDKSDHIDTVVCYDEFVVLSFTSQQQAESHEGLFELQDVIVGSRLWACQSSAPKAFIKKISGVRRVDNKLILKTSEGALTDVFKNANVKFSTNMIPKSQTVPSDPIVLDQQAAISKRGFFSNFFSDVWSGIKDLANTVSKIVNVAINVVNAVVTGDLSGQDTQTMDLFNWNWNGANGANNVSIELGDGVVCSNCYAYFTLTVNLNIDIQNYQLLACGASVTGIAEANLEAELELDETFKRSWLVYTASSPPAYFQLGPVPMTFQVIVPITLGYDARVYAYASVGVQLSAGADLNFGMQYDPQVDNITFTHSSDFYFNHGQLTQINEGVSVDVEFYVLPVVYVQIDYIGGPYLSPKLFIELSASQNNSNNNCYEQYGYDAFAGALNWGVQASIGAKVDITLLGGKTLFNWQGPPLSLYSIKKPITTGCITFGSDTELESSNSSNSNFTFNSVPLMPGNVWAGYQYCNCDNYPPYASVGLQFIEEINETSCYMVAGFNFLLEANNSACVSQTLMVASYTNSSILLTPVTNDYGEQVGYTQCTIGNYTDIILAPTIEGSTSSDWFSITGGTLDNCCTFKYYQQDQEDE